MKEHFIETTRQARYFSLGENNANLRDVWIVLHGYLQHPLDLLAHFSFLNNGHTLVIAPEGLSRAYRKGVSGAVGASWMTKECRAEEISDYVSFLNKLFAHLSKDFPAHARLHLLGFSQGVAALCRWYAQSDIQAHQIILWCGSIPDEVTIEKGKKEWPYTSYVCARNDIFVSHDMQKKNVQRLHDAGIPVNEITFDGKHEIDDALLQKMASLTNT